MNKLIVIIGAGFGGVSIAREIRARDLADVVLLEKESALGAHASGRNSGVGHAGFNYPPETLKAALCVEGNRMLREFCQSNHVPFYSCGTLVVAQDDREAETLKKYEDYGLVSGVPGIRIIGKEELKERESYARGVRALFAPSGFIVGSKKLLEALAKDAQNLGVEIFFDAEVAHIDRKRVFTSRGNFDSYLIINSAGLQVDRIAHMTGVAAEYRVIPIAGHYKKSAGLRVNSMIYPVKNEKFPQSGVHLTRTIEGHTIAGPTATLSLSGREGYDRKITLSGLFELLKEPAIKRWGVRTLRDSLTRQEVMYNLMFAVPRFGNRAFVEAIKKIYDGEVNSQDLEPYRTGIRAQLIDRNGNMIEDFRVLEGEYSLNIMNLNSPGMTSCLSAARYFVDRYVEPKIK